MAPDFKGFIVDILYEQRLLDGSRAIEKEGLKSLAYEFSKTMTLPRKGQAARFFHLQRKFCARHCRAFRSASAIAQGAETVKPVHRLIPAMIANMTIVRLHCAPSVTANLPIGAVTNCQLLNLQFSVRSARTLGDL